MTAKEPATAEMALMLTRIAEAHHATTMMELKSRFKRIEARLESLSDAIAQITSKARSTTEEDPT